MFRKTETNPQLDLFTAPSTILPKRAQKKYTDEKAWHNQFFKLVTSRIDEEAFMPLFEETNMGAPNASIRILVAMSILKEGFGCSDEALFEKCEFDLLARKALGLEMLNPRRLRCWKDRYPCRHTNGHQGTGLRARQRRWYPLCRHHVEPARLPRL